MEQFESFFRDRGIRLTEPRREVFSILNEHEQPLTISELLKFSKIAERTSVYRTLDLFVRHGIVQMLQLKGKQRFELAEPFKAHHHHLVCTRCGELIQIDQQKLERIISRIADSHRYQLTSHHVELQGLCRDCQRK
jgi:Fur family ferric uptake transcriptional regulator